MGSRSSIVANSLKVGHASPPSHTRGRCPIDARQLFFHSGQQTPNRNTRAINTRILSLIKYTILCCLSHHSSDSALPTFASNFFSRLNALRILILILISSSFDGARFCFFKIALSLRKVAITFFLSAKTSDPGRTRSLPFQFLLNVGFAAIDNFLHNSDIVLGCDTS